MNRSTIFCAKPVVLGYSIVARPIMEHAASVTVKQVALLVDPTHRLKAQPLRLLDVGIGTGAFTVRAARAWPNANLVGIDPSEAMLEETARRLKREGNLPRVKLCQGNAIALPLQGWQFFDAAIYNYVLRYIRPEDLEATVSEMARMVRPGRLLVVTDLALPHLKVLDSTVLGLWSRPAELADSLRRAGFVHLKTQHPLLSVMYLYRRQEP